MEGDPKGMVREREREQENAESTMPPIECDPACSYLERMLLRKAVAGSSGTFINIAS